MKEFKIIISNFIIAIGINLAYLFAVKGCWGLNYKEDLDANYLQTLCRYIEIKKII